MKNQYILMLTDDEVKALIAANENIAEILEKQANFYVKKAEVDAIAEDIQNLLK